MAYHLTIYARSGGLIEGFPGYVYCYFLNGGLACVDYVLEGYTPDVLPISDAEMFGFIRNNGGTIQVSNQIFETRLYNFFLSQEEIYQIGVDEKKKSRLDMDHVLERYAIVYDDLYGNSGTNSMKHKDVSASSCSSARSSMERGIIMLKRRRATGNGWIW